MEIQSTGRFSLVLASPSKKSPLLADEMHQNLEATVRNACLLFAPQVPSSNGRF